ncbi:DedA family protein [Peribacillus sp. Hz7]|uniref:DedA family protein n=1 Tax=Peribacillus sp. Hz7 TaxID=3344873 RepID=UPI0035CAB93A
MQEQLNYLIEHYGYLGVTGVLIAGIVGLPLPDEVILTYVGYNVSKGEMSYILALICVFIGAIVGISISFQLGNKLGLPFIRKFGPKFHLTEKRIHTTEKLFNKFGPYLLFIGYFIPGVRHITAYLAGINSLSFREFALYAYSGAILWGFTFVTLGRELGNSWHKVEFYMSQYSIYFISLVLMILLFVMYLYWRKGLIK